MTNDPLLSTIICLLGPSPSTAASVGYSYFVFEALLASFFMELLLKRSVWINRAAVSPQLTYYLFLCMYEDHHVDLSEIYQKYLFPCIYFQFSLVKSIKEYLYILVWPSVCRLLLAVTPDNGNDIDYLETTIINMDIMLNGSFMFDFPFSCSELEILDFLVPHFFFHFWPRLDLFDINSCYSIFQKLCEKFPPCQLHLYHHCCVVLPFLRTINIPDAVNATFLRTVMTSLVEYLVLYTSGVAGDEIYARFSSIMHKHRPTDVLQSSRLFLQSSFMPPFLGQWLSTVYMDPDVPPRIFVDDMRKITTNLSWFLQSLMKLEISGIYH